MAQAPSSSSKYGDIYEYDVCLSYRIEDSVEFSGLLYEALCKRGIRTFNDCEVADEISPALVEAIQRSRTAVIVLSKNYASSSFCLDKLSKILDHFKGKARLVYPIFYHVEPGDVQKLRGTYGEAMAIHKERFDDRLPKWTLALQQVANLSGYHFRHGIEYDHVFISKIAKEVFRSIIYMPLDVAEYPVGLEPRVQKVIQFLDLESGGKVHMVGICGVAGIGKTTLARAVHNSIADQFELVCFLHDVMEHSNKHGLVHLQETLLNEISGSDLCKLQCLRDGTGFIRRRLCKKKVLLILDDVNKKQQLEALAGSPNWFGPGSRVIITTPDKGLLARWFGPEVLICEVNELTKKEALDLLTWSAFKNNQVDSGYTDVVNRAATLASGLPLFLKVIGSSLYGKSAEEWVLSLDLFERTPDVKLQSILKHSFDSLDTMLQGVFVDIVCCFRGYQLDELKHIFMVIDIAILVEKSLINISPSGEITIHALIGSMGKEIFRLESPKELGERSRLWIPDDILHVLEDCTGTEKIKTICLDLSSTKEEKIHWNGAGFKNMTNLNILIIKNAHFSQAPRHLPTSLRMLEWQRYPSQYLPPDFHPENLAICRLPKRCFVSSEIGGLLNKKSVLEKPVNLDDLPFRKSEHSNEMLHVSCLPNSEEMTVKVSY